MKKQFKNLIFTLLLVIGLIFITGCTLPEVPDNGGDITNTPETLLIPSDFQVTSGTENKATWTVDPNAVSYKIYIYKNDALLTSLSGTSGLVLNLTENGTYQAAIKVIGDGTFYYSSDLSERVTFEFTGGINPDLPKLSTPTNVAASFDKTTSKLTVSFKDNADYTNATGYKVYIYSGTLLKNTYSLTRNGGNFEVNLTDGVYNVYVVALGDNQSYRDSSLSTEKITFIISSGSTSSNFDFTSHSNYYISAKNLSGDALEDKLTDIITSTHKNKRNYDNLRQDLQKTDADPNNSNNLILFYSQQSVKAAWDSGNTWNREHVWPNSKGVGESGPGADAHHLRPADPSVNSTRGNKKMGNITGSKTEIMFKKTIHTYCYYSGDIFEPRDDIKGDIARIYFYLLTRYPYLYNNLSGVADIKTLVEWNALDPVSDSEIRRNEAAYKIQGNRNPFIDNSDFVNLIWA